MARSTANPLVLGSQLALWPYTWWQMFWAASETVSHRLAMLALAGPLPDARTRRESQRMVAEKMDAAMESAQVAGKLLLAQELMPALGWWKGWQGGIPGLFDTYWSLFHQAARIQRQTWEWPLAAGARLIRAAEDGVEPWRRRVTANARRLR